MRATLVLAVACLPAVANASPRCRFSWLTEYDACSTEVPALSVEAGMAVMHYTPDKIDDDHGGNHLMTTPADHGLAATGARLRAGTEIDHAWYGGVEFDFARFGGPQLTDATIDREVPVMTAVPTRGEIIQAKLVLARRASAGVLTFSGEVAPGLQVATYTTTSVPNYVEPWVQSWLVIEGHAKVDAWLSSRMTASIEMSTDLLHYDRVQVALLLGMHLRRR